MNISQKTDYGLILLVHLCKNTPQNPYSLKDIAEANHISFYFLQKAALDLRKAGIIKSERGKHGGYRIVSDPGKITIIDVLEALEGPLALIQCLVHGSDGKKCTRQDICRIKNGFGKINERILKALSKFTLKDFINS